MTRALDFAFPLQSDLSRRAPQTVPLEEQRIGLEGELNRRLRLYPGYVARHTMEQADADRQIAILRALIVDVRHAEWIDAGRRSPKPPAPTPATSWSWEDRVRELRRDIAIRRNAYPRWIASATNPLTADDAAAALEWLDAVHYRYWAQLDCFSGTCPPVDDHARVAWIAAAERDYRKQEWNAALGAGGVRRRRLAWRDRTNWQVIGLLAERLLQRREPLCDIAGQTTLDQLLAHSRRVYEATIVATNAGDRPRHILVLVDAEV